jgi:hypothetical protein
MVTITRVMKLAFTNWLFLYDIKFHQGRLPCCSYANLKIAERIMNSLDRMPK